MTKSSVYIETDRLIVRTFEDNDIAAFTKLLDIYDGWQEQKPYVNDFFAWHLSNYKEMDIVNGCICFGIFLKDTGQIVGQVAAQKHHDLHEPEFGYGLIESARGNGYAKEAAKAFLKWIEDRYGYDMPYIIGTVESSNIASQKVIEHCGFQLVKELYIPTDETTNEQQFKYYKYDFNTK